MPLLHDCIDYKILSSVFRRSISLCHVALTNSLLRIRIRIDRLIESIVDFDFEAGSGLVVNHFCYKVIMRNLNCLLRKSRTRNSVVRVQHCATLFGTQSIIFCSKYYSESLTHSHSRITPQDVSRGVTVNVPTIENTTVPIQIKPPSNFAEAAAAKRYFLSSLLLL